MIQRQEASFLPEIHAHGSCAPPSAAKRSCSVISEPVDAVTHRLIQNFQPPLVGRLTGTMFRVVLVQQERTVHHPMGMPIG
jgi:hypothetical protein